jgi:hypothetical protein
LFVLEALNKSLPTLETDSCSVTLLQPGRQVRNTNNSPGIMRTTDDAAQVGEITITT